MSFDEEFLAELVEAVTKAGLQVIVIGNAAAIVHGVPVLTKDIDLMVLDHPQLEKNCKDLHKFLTSNSCSHMSRQEESFAR
ncbi:MAG: hypothetical protein ONB44_03115 [candidate division KSB1 bacterium]|nr:hypothetical protein [candidate division KSB1 bacterium]MDZ7301117.1 hypothetical protein [candidate division KSB1 bacterium]MDZ7311998.1 hypothetical protein [candidate division KSB1 bacterium]